MPREETMQPGQCPEPWRLQPLGELQYLNNLPKAGPAQPSGLVSPEKGPGLKWQAISDRDSVSQNFLPGERELEP